MPTTKKYQRKRTTAKRAKKQSFTKRVLSVVDTRIETKEHHVNSGTSADSINNQGTLYFLSNVTQGTSDATRIGDEITLQRLNMRLRIVASANPPDVMRVIIFRWKPKTYFTTFSFSMSEILYDYLNTGQDYQNAMSSYNNKNKKQYVVLKDMFLKGNTGTWQIHAFNININLRDVVAEYESDRGSNQIFMFVLAEGAGSGNTCSCVHNTTLYYKDG